VAFESKVNVVESYEIQTRADKEGGVIFLVVNGVSAI